MTKTKLTIQDRREFAIRKALIALDKDLRKLGSELADVSVAEIVKVTKGIYFPT